MARIVMAALGSMGDVFPVLGMAQQLAGQNHDVTVVTTHNFATHVQWTGARQVAVGEPGAFEDAVQRLDARNRLRTLQRGIGNLLAKVEPVYRAVTRLEPDLIVANSLSVGAALAARRHHVRFSSVVSQTVMMRSLHAPPAYTARDVHTAPTPLQMRLRYAATDATLDLLLGRAINRFGKSIQLPAVSWRRDPWWFLSPTQVLLTWPAWFAPRDAAWPAHARHVGFVLPEIPVGGSPPDWPARVAALAPRPLLFTPGSWTTHAQQFFGCAVAVCRSLSRPGIFLTSHRDQLPAPPGPDIVSLDYAPMGPLLDHCAAVIHHGGPGTAAHGLHAGIPQLTLPQMFDQFDNTRHLQRLGVGTAAPLDAAAMTRALDRLLTSSQVAQQCAAWAQVTRAPPVDATPLDALTAALNGPAPL